MFLDFKKLSYNLLFFYEKSPKLIFLILLKLNQMWFKLNTVTGAVGVQGAYKSIYKLSFYPIELNIQNLLEFVS